MSRLRITLRRKRLASAVADSDAQRRHKIRIRLGKVSSVVRKTELAALPKGDGVLALKSDLPPAKQEEVDAAMSEKMRKIRSARKFYGKHMPPLQCNACSMSRVCAKFRAGYECAFLPYLNNHKVETAADLVHYMKELVGANMRRAHLMTMTETANGAVPSLETSEAMQLAFMQLKQLHDVMSESSEDSISIETDDTSVIGQLFGNLRTMKTETAAMKGQQAELAAAIPVASLDVTEKPVHENVVDELVKAYARQGADLMPEVKQIDLEGHPAMKQAIETSKGAPMPTIEVSTSL